MWMPGARGRWWMPVLGRQRKGWEGRPLSCFFLWPCPPTDSLMSHSLQTWLTFGPVWPVGTSWEVAVMRLVRANVPITICLQSYMLLLLVVVVQQMCPPPLVCSVCMWLWFFQANVPTVICVQSLHVVVVSGKCAHRHLFAESICYCWFRQMYPLQLICRVCILCLFLLFQAVVPTNTCL